MATFIREGTPVSCYQTAPRGGRECIACSPYVGQKAKKNQYFVELGSVLSMT